jgi:hypothetical protein
MFNNDLHIELNNSDLVCTTTDAPNKNDTKIVPAIVHYFLAQAGVKVELLNFKDVHGETSEILTTWLLSFCYQETGNYKKSSRILWRKL